MNLEGFLNDFKLPELEKIPKNIIYIIIALKVINIFEKFISKGNLNSPIDNLNNIPGLDHLPGLGSLSGLAGLGNLTDLSSLSGLSGLGALSGLNKIPKVCKPKSQISFMTFFLVFMLIGSIIVFMNKLLDKISISLMTNDMSDLYKLRNQDHLKEMGCPMKKMECPIKKMECPFKKMECPMKKMECPFFSNKLEDELEKIADEK